MNYSSAYWERVKAHYIRHRAEILAAPHPWSWGIDPYAWDFDAGIRMTPIESALWFDIRDAFAVLYPQYPVAGHFVDFGNPLAKVAIECDGAQFHTDKKRDAERQARIESEGWTVYRITGSDCVKTDRPAEDDHGRQRFEFGPARLFMADIAARHNLTEPRNG